LININDVVKSAAKDIEEQLIMQIYNDILKELGISQESYEKKKIFPIMDNNLEVKLLKKQIGDFFNKMKE
jgi:hypothetical protein